jgi:uncharacterized damage-inducible protein DinB
VTELNKIAKDTDMAPSIQFLLAQMEETRGRLLRLLEKIPEDVIDKTPNDEEIESIATLLDHIAGIEWSWIFEDIDGEEMDFEDWKYGFATRPSVETGQRTGMGMKFYLDRLHKVREEVRARIKDMKEEDRYREVGQGEEKYTIEWILYHLNHHEAQHHGQISLLNRIFNKS